MTLEWLRRRDPALDEQLRRYLFTSEPIVSLEAPADGEASASDLGIGSLRSAS